MYFERETEPEKTLEELGKIRPSVLEKDYCQLRSKGILRITMVDHEFLHSLGVRWPQKLWEEEPDF